ncbi:MAG: hypothetical protein SWH61_14255 [Thermodesulfobacteriota bacterium]|nr:hypothetical protein [Thermodesulfobacteriota bacterium]
MVIPLIRKTKSNPKRTKLIVSLIFFLMLGIGCDPVWKINKLIIIENNIDVQCMIQATKKVKNITGVFIIDKPEEYNKPIIEFHTPNCVGWIKVYDKGNNIFMIEIYQTGVGVTAQKFKQPAEEQFMEIANSIISYCGGRLLW